MIQPIISEDQNTVTWNGRMYYFKPIKEVTIDTCKKECRFGNASKACSLDICSSTFRKDGREGVFINRKILNNSLTK